MKLRRLFWLVAHLAMLFAFSCSVPLVPPPSFSKYVRDKKGDKNDDKGKVSASAGGVFMAVESSTEDNYNSSIYAPVAEASLSAWLADGYDLALSVHSGSQLAMEGDLILLESARFRLGLLHGAGIGLNMGVDKEIDDWDGQLFYSFSGGLIAQLNSGSTGIVFLGSKYSHSRIEDPGDDEYKPNFANYVTSSLGYVFAVGRLRITPELIFSWGKWVDRNDVDDHKSDVWMILPSVAFAAPF